MTQDAVDIVDTVDTGLADPGHQHQDRFAGPGYRPTGVPPETGSAAPVT